LPQLNNIARTRLYCPYLKLSQDTGRGVPISGKLCIKFSNRWTRLLPTVFRVLVELAGALSRRVTETAAREALEIMNGWIAQGKLKLYELTKKRKKCAAD